MSTSPSQILTAYAYADPFIGRPELVETFADFERSRIVLDYAHQFRAAQPLQNVSELIRLGGGEEWVQLMQTFKDRCQIAFSSSSVETRYHAARMRVAAECVSAATGFYDQLEIYIEQNAALAQRLSLPSVMVGVPLDTENPEPALWKAIDRIEALEAESLSLLADIIEPAEVSLAQDALATSTTLRRNIADNEGAGVKPLPSRVVKAIRLADVFVGRMYLDRRYLRSVGKIALATADSLLERLEETGRLTRLNGNEVVNSGAGLFIPEMHARRTVFYQANALRPLLGDLPRPKQALAATDQATQQAAPNRIRR